MAIGKNIRYYRLRAGMTQCDLAKRIRIHGRNLDRSYISHVERGDFEPSLAVIRACGRALGVRPWTLVADIYDSTDWWERYLSLSPVHKRAVQHLVKYYYEGAHRF